MPSRILLRTGLRDLLRRPLHTGLMVLGVALGVAVVVAIDLASESARRGLARSTAVVLGRATHQIVGGRAGVPQDLYERLRTEWGLRSSAPVVEGYCLGLDEPAGPLRVLGVDPLAEGAFRGHLEEGSVGLPGFDRFFTSPGAVLLSAEMAQRSGLSPGSRFRVLVDDREHELEAIGHIVPADQNEAAGLEGLLLMDVGSAQKLFDRLGRLSRIDLIASPAEIAALQPRLPQGVRVAVANEQADTVLQLTEAFHLNLLALSLLALLVGMFLIYNTVMFSVVRRRAVIGTLRALGVTRGQVVALILLETALASSLGALLGLGLGWLLGQGAIRLVTQTINDLYYVLAVVAAPLSLGTVAKGLLLGVGAGVLAAVVPALEAARVPPVMALRPSTLESRTRRWLPRLALGGVVSAGLGGALLALSESTLAGSFLGLFGIVFGLALLTPAATVVLMRVAGPALRELGGSLGSLAGRTLTRSISRSGVAVAALMVAVSVTISVSVMIGSFRDTVINWLEVTLVADLYLSAPFPSDRGAPALSPDVLERVVSVPGVGAVETFRSVQVDSSVGTIRLAAADLVPDRMAALFRFTSKSPEEAWREMHWGAVAVSEPFAHRHGIPLEGGSLEIQTDGGLHTFPVAGVFYDYSTDQGYVLMSRQAYDRHFDDPLVTSIAAYVEPGVSLGETVDALRAALADRVVRISSNRSLKEGVLVVFDRTFLVTNALRLLAVVVAFIGIWSALMALHLERTRELGTLRALGLTPAGLARLVLLESGLMGGVAGVLSWPTGILLSYVLIHVINVRSFGWTMQMQLDPWLFLQALGMSVAASLLAALYPVWRLRRSAVAEALRQE